MNKCFALNALAATCPPRLPDDVCRCHDEQCSEREECRRFLQRNTGGVHVKQAASLRDQGKTCARRMVLQ
jgi:hypothetical protein